MSDATQNETMEVSYTTCNTLKVYCVIRSVIKFPFLPGLTIFHFSIEGKHCADDGGESEEYQRTTAARLASASVGQRARGRL